MPDLPIFNFKAPRHYVPCMRLHDELKELKSIIFLECPHLVHLESCFYLVKLILHRCVLKREVQIPVASRCMIDRGHSKPVVYFIIRDFLYVLKCNDHLACRDMSLDLTYTYHPFIRAPRQLH